MAVAQRPWIGVLEMKHDKASMVSPPSRFWLIVTNTGKSPALEGSFKFECGAFKDFPANPPYRHAPKKADKLVLIPEARVATAPILKRLTTDEEGDVATRRKTFYVYALIHYRDPLTKERHFTKFCAVWQPMEIEGFGDPDNPTGSFAMCPFYNDAN
jgi:hypothetical protein